MSETKPAAPATREDADERLLVEAAQKDPARFLDLYELHFERIYAFLARRVRNRELAEDLTAEVFHKALANLQRFRWTGAPFAAWLIRIALNALADQVKRDAREVSGAEEFPAASSQPDLEALERRARLFRLVGRLPADQRRVVIQRFVEQRSIREIAQQLGRTEGAVKQLQFRALQNLRAQMEGAYA